MTELDLSFLYQFTNGKEYKIKRYISLYLQEAPNILKRMQQNLDDTDFSTLAINAHSLKPQAEFMGLLELKSILVSIEEKGEGKTELSKLKILLEKALRLHQQAVPKLERKIEELSVK